MRRFFSRYTLRYPRSLVYMLQASEYYLGDYFEWYFGVKDFTKVEKVGKLKFTKKATLLYIFAWLVYLLLAAKMFIMTLVFFPQYGYGNLLWLLLIPFFLPYIIVIPLLILKYLVQWPLEQFIKNGLKKKIAAQPGVKIAIAGSYGKTTMREILATVLGSGKKVAAPGGSLNTLWGIYSFMKTLEGDEEVLIFELGEYYPGDVRRLAEVTQPDMGVITGINEAHLKRFGSLEKTVATIYELVDFLGDKTVYINGDNELAKKNARGNFHLYTSEGVESWKVSKSASGLSGTDLVITKDKNELKLHSGLLGLHLIGSLAVAVAISDKLGLTDKQIIAGVAATKPFSRRLELVSSGDIVILDDSYNANPDGVKAVIDFTASIKGYRKTYVTSGLVEMGGRSKEVHYQLARELVEAKIDNIMMVPNTMTRHISDGLTKYGFQGKITWFDTMQQIRESLPHLLAKGDLVLLSTDLPDQYR